MEPKIPDEFFTAGSIATFAGATGAVWVLTNVFRVLLKRDSILFGFIVSLMISFVGAYAAHTLTSLVQVFLIFLNGCLLFLTAAGVQGFANEAGKRSVDRTKLHGRRDVGFLTPWFKDPKAK